MKTMGQAIDEAITMHTARYPGSAVYDAQVLKTATAVTGVTLYRVELEADHFSQPLVYSVKG